MTKANILEILKTDLEVGGTGRDNYLNQLIDLAEAAITREGVSLNISDVPEDGMLIESYAAFLYRKRRQADQAMPRPLRYMLNNKLLAQKATEVS